jgi:FixJ family two-component response regulator
VTKRETVFLVDDDAAVRKSLTRLLQSAGLEARAFGGANEFLEALEPGATGCVVLDLSMPGRDGLAIQNALLERAAGRLPDGAR